MDVRGQMNVTYRGGRSEHRNVPDWTPAWQCFFSDGTFRITLMRCANDVRSGGGMEALPDTQIRPRQDIPERVVQQQVWPEVVDTPLASPVTVPMDEEGVVEYISVRISSPTRFVLHRASGRETVVDISVLSDLVTLGVEGDTIYAVVGGQRHTIGRIVTDSSSEQESLALVR